MKTSLMVRIITQPGNAAPKVIDYRNSSDRRWLTNHIYWALTNDHSISIIPIQTH